MITAPTPAAYRKLASIAVITAVDPIVGADAIEVVSILGWKAVVSKDAHLRVGQHVIYVETDALLPTQRPAALTRTMAAVAHSNPHIDHLIEVFAFLAARGVKTQLTTDGMRHTGHVLRTVKLRGQLSQGLVLDPADFALELADAGINADNDVFVGADVTAALGIVKYDPPVPAELLGVAVGNFPTQFAPVTGSIRVQNFTDLQLSALKHQTLWTATEKLDGESVTFIKDPQSHQIRACSHWLERVVTDELPSIVCARAQGIIEAMSAGMAVQAELVGPGIKKNPLRLSEKQVIVFAVLSNNLHMPRALWPDAMLDHEVPVLELDFPTTVAMALEQANTLYSYFNSQARAEGIVWHSDGAMQELDGGTSFKALSNTVLLKNKD